MDPSQPQPPPIGFEMQNIQNPNGAPAVGFERLANPLYPNLENQQPGGTAPIGFEGQSQPEPPSNGAAPIGLEGQTEPEPLGNDGAAPIGLEAHTPAAGGDQEDNAGDMQAEDGDDNQHADEKSPLSPGHSPKKEISKKETCFFDDGVRKIDYILAFIDDGTKDKDAKKKDKRDIFMKNLEEEGLQLEIEEKEKSQNGKICYVKLHATWEVLTRHAELMKMKMPLAEDITSDLVPQFNALFQSWVEKDAQQQKSCFEKIPNPFELGDRFLHDDPDYFTMAFNRNNQELFHIEDKSTFFTNAQRSRIVWNILCRCPYGFSATSDEEDMSEPKKKIGIRRLLNIEAFSACYPLHEGSYTSEHSLLTEGAMNERHLLYEAWARPRMWYKYQPLDLIRKYFGEKIGIYFCWLGFYTSMLIPASIIGLAVFIYGCATIFDNIPSEDICNVTKAGGLIMCPLCDKYCAYWKLKKSCLFSRLTYIFDNPATVFFAGFMCLWATMFLEMWKRKEAEIGYDWDVAGFEEEEEVIRPEFEIAVNDKRRNPVTQEEEPYVPFYKRAPIDCSSFVVCIFMVCLCLCAVFAIIVYRIIIVTLMSASSDGIIREYAKILTTATAALISLIIIMILNKLYERIALFLTNWENPRTETEYDDRLTFKMFCFQFVNYYSTIFYIAFFKGRLIGRPGNYDYSFVYRQEECDPAGCLIELCIQLGVTMVGKQGINNFKEIMLPKIKNWWLSRAARKQEKHEMSVYTRWEQDYDLDTMANTGLFEEYLEMVIQYGFVTIFVAAFPLAPLFALINNVIEIRVDAYKFTTQWRRPMAQRGQDIGIWYSILLAVSRIAVISNAFIIAFTSDFIPKMVYKMTNEDTLTGYINSSLSTFKVADFQSSSNPEPSIIGDYANITYCRYRDYRSAPDTPNEYEFTLTYWHIFAARISFVIVFEHVVILLTWLLNVLIPDVPRSVKDQMLRENYIAKEAIYEIESRKVRSAHL
ncbi:anoctamin-4-like [Tubulanus polymorphus]|uniref:anoctamin-4-like n=1 Tax=Tubulanus polymorphus TaxID=672921 RepID=UPI003DA4F0D3